MHCAAFTAEEEARLEWIIGNRVEDGMLSKHSHLAERSTSDVILEFGPR